MIKAQPSLGGPRPRFGGGGIGGLGYLLEHHNLLGWHRYFGTGPPSGGLSGGLFAIISTAKTRIKMFRIMLTNYVWISRLNAKYLKYPISKKTSFKELFEDFCRCHSECFCIDVDQKLWCFFLFESMKLVSIASNSLINKYDHLFFSREKKIHYTRYFLCDR